MTPHRSAIAITAGALLFGVSVWWTMGTLTDAAYSQGIAATGVTVLGVLLISRLRRWQWLTAGVLLALVIIMAIGGFWFSLDAWGISDWDYYFSLHETIRRTVLEYHQLPFWNPYTCGGTAALGDPEFSLFTPTFALELLLGIPRGLRVVIYVATVTGALGMLALSKRVGLSVYAALLVALGYALGSVNLLEIVEGHPNIFSAAWIPWIFWSWLAAYQELGNRKQGIRRQKWTIICGIFLALTFYQGGIYLLMYTGLAFLVLPWLTKQPRRAIGITVQAGLWALGLAAFKLVPVLFWLQQFQDEMYAGSNYTLPYLHKIFFGRYLHDSEVFANQGSGWHEYGAYLGIVIGVLALVGLLASRHSRLLRGLVIAAIVAMLVSSTGPLLEPLFDRAPFLPRSNISRLILFAVIPLVLLAGTGFDLLRRKVTTPTRPFLSAAIVGLVALDLMTLSYALSLQAFVLPPVVPAVARAPAPIAFTAHTYKYRHKGDDYTRAYAATVAGYGTLSYCSVLTPPPQIRTIHDEVDNGYLSHSSTTVKGQVDSWSPNRVVVTVDTQEPTDLVLNTNFARGWQVNGSRAQEIVGRVGTRLAPGSHHLTFSYWPPGFTFGTIITLLTTLLALALVWRGK